MVVDVALVAANFDDRRITARGTCGLGAHGEARAVGDAGLPGSVDATAVPRRDHLVSRTADHRKACRADDIARPDDARATPEWRVVEVAASGSFGHWSVRDGHRREAGNH